VSKLNGVSHVQSERRRRRLRERRCDGSEQVLREYTLHSNSFNFLQFVDKLVWQWVLHMQLAVVCRVAGMAPFSLQTWATITVLLLWFVRERE
jgi:hypothetical protein